MLFSTYKLKRQVKHTTCMIMDGGGILKLSQHCAFKNIKELIEYLLMVIVCTDNDNKGLLETRCQVLKAHNKYAHEQN